MCPYAQHPVQTKPGTARTGATYEKQSHKHTKGTGTKKHGKKNGQTQATTHGKTSGMKQVPNEQPCHPPTRPA